MAEGMEGPFGKVDMVSQAKERGGLGVGNLVKRNEVRGQFSLSCCILEQVRAE